MEIIDAWGGVSLEHEHFQKRKFWTFDPTPWVEDVHHNSWLLHSL